MTTPTIRLIKFGGKWCSACNAMDKARMLEQFVAVTPDVLILKHECPAPDDDSEDPIADEYDAMSMPTLVFEDIASGKELLRFEGGLPLSKLRELYADVKAIQAGTKKPAKRSARYAPREGGYPGVQARAEANVGTDSAALDEAENDS